MIRRHARAQAVVWVAVLLPAFFLPVLGLSIDASVLFDARRDLQNVADAAARVGAMEIDRDFLVAPGNPTGQIRLDEQAARAETVRYLRDRAHLDDRGGSWERPEVSNDTVSVTVKRELKPPFLRLFTPRRTFEVTATGHARPCSGVSQQVMTCN